MLQLPMLLAHPACVICVACGVAPADDDPALGCPVEYINLKGTSRENPAVCKYTGNKYYRQGFGGFRPAFAGAQRACLCVACQSVHLPCRREPALPSSQLPAATTGWGAARTEAKDAGSSATRDPC